MLQITYTHPDGTQTTDNRPGHTMTGILYYIDPFQRYFGSLVW